MSVSARESASAHVYTMMIISVSNNKNTNIIKCVIFLASAVPQWPSEDDQSSSSSGSDPITDIKTNKKKGERIPVKGGCFPPFGEEETGGKTDARKMKKTEEGEKDPAN